MVGLKLINALQDTAILAPYVKRAMLRDVWPDSMEISDPYFHDSNHDDYFHPSVHALYGEQAIYAKLHPDLRVLIREDPSYERTMTPMFGSIYHLLVQQKLIADGVVEPEDVEVSLVDEERHWKGRADLIFQRKLFDLKSMNSRSSDRIEEPYDSWRYQIHPYLDRCRALGLTDSMEGNILVMEMGKPWRLKEFRIPFDQNIMDEIYTKWGNVRKALETETIPETCCKPEYSRYCPVACRGQLAP